MKVQVTEYTPNNGYVSVEWNEDQDQRCTLTGHDFGTLMCSEETLRAMYSILSFLFEKRKS